MFKQLEPSAREIDHSDHAFPTPLQYSHYVYTRSTYNSYTNNDDFVSGTIKMVVSHNAIMSQVTTVAADIESSVTAFRLQGMPTHPRPQKDSSRTPVD